MHKRLSSAYGKNCSVKGYAKRSGKKWRDTLHAHKGEKCEYFVTKRKVAALFGDCVRAAVKNGFETHYTSKKDGKRYPLPGGPTPKPPFACDTADALKAQAALNAL